MKLVTRAALGWPPSAAPLQSATNGVKVHYEGTPVSLRLLDDHNACLAEWKAIRASHLANTVENYSDVAYNYAACPHGYLLEGRGIGRRTGANGNQDLNRAHYAIVGLVGSSGLTTPTDPMLDAIRDGIDLLRDNGAGREVKGHRDGYATDCPGGPLYAWVQRGAPRPGVTPTPIPEEDDMTPEQATQLKKIYDAQVPYSGWQYKGQGTQDAWALLNSAATTATAAVKSVAALGAKVDALKQPVLTSDQLTALAAQVAAHPTLADRIAELVADKLATRLAD
ncbi:peptidoglycan recognition family protein [Streptomyces sp. SP18ES09]|uniref:peptidoglycan recognition protein family protein n=1 Tax=Streptomyces sp. SP18ES09 TaxID=3002532 RepID=UPI002E75A0C7|nr:peptidoglycan recognition family protein [Streptomyces sp. SP18ES09]MEE1813612.1 peptidoglycan recognition family protein [Streptomyces sp. SP18ES09]